MLSFDFSAFDLVLSIGVIVLIVLFVTTLLKLNPSGENKESKNVKVYEEVKEEQELTTLTQDFTQLEKASASHTFPQSAERTTSEKLQPPQVIVGVAAGGASQESLEQPSKSYGYKEPPKNHKSKEVQKAAPKISEEKDCLHFFGYLGGLPKNTPIPGECFGCQRIVDCLITPKKKP